MDATLHRSGRARARGASLIEVLITLVIVAFSLLGLAGFVARTGAVGVESHQRARALALLEDMAARIRNNKVDAGAYLAPVPLGEASQDCSALAGSPRDLCEWNNLLFGSNDAHTLPGATQALTFRGCVTQPLPGQPVFVVSVAWSAVVAGTAPVDGCAVGAFGDEAYRRTVRTQVRIASLSA